MDAAGPQDLPPLPSDKQIITPSYMNLCSEILGVVVANDLHVRPKRVQQAVAYLWTNAGHGVCNGVYAPWSSARAHRNMKLRIEAILVAYDKEDSGDPSDTDLNRIRGMARRIVSEREESVVEAARERRRTQDRADRQREQNHAMEAALGLF